MIERGQASIQLIVAVIILFIVFALIVSYTIQGNKNNAVIANDLLLESDCKKISNSISRTFLSPGSETKITIESNALIQGNGIILTKKGEISAFCYFNGVIKKDYDFNKGQITIKNNNGIIEIE